MQSIVAEDILFITSDVTACAFLVVLITSITFQNARTELSHLLSAAILNLAGILVRISARGMSMLPEAFEWSSGAYVNSTAMAITLLIISYALITIGITESVTYLIYINEENRRDFVARYVTCALFIIIGSVLFYFVKNLKVFSLLILIQFISYWTYLFRNWSEQTRREYTRASIFAAATFILALAFENARITGLGLSVMMMILTEQYHDHIRRELAENEAALAKSRVQLLADQISPHYIYNCLQSISGLCDSNPEKAKEAIDLFSGYLRGNLESITEEDLIPFARELEITKAYLELERLTDRRNFEVRYELETTDFMLPPLVLQPVVENAVKHGAYRTLSGADRGIAGVTEITIAARTLGGYICIEVTDRTEGRDAAAAGAASAGAGTGPRLEMPETAKNRNKRKSVGLENVRTRLAIQSGGTLETKSTDSGTKVTIMLPES